MAQTYLHKQVVCQNTNECYHYVDQADVKYNGCVWVSLLVEIHSRNKVVIRKKKTCPTQYQTYIHQAAMISRGVNMDVITWGTEKAKAWIISSSNRLVGALNILHLPCFPALRNLISKFLFVKARWDNIKSILIWARLQEIWSTEILEVNLFAFAYRLFHEGFSPIYEVLPIKAPRRALQNKVIPEYIWIVGIRDQTLNHRHHKGYQEGHWLCMGGLWGGDGSCKGQGEWRMGTDLAPVCW